MDSMYYYDYSRIKYQPNYETQQNEYPVDHRELNGISNYPQNSSNWQERRLEDRYNECFERFDVFHRPLSANHNNWNNWNSQRGKRRARHHLDDVYLPNYEDTSLRGYKNIERHTRGRSSYRSNRGSRYSRNRKIVTSKFKTVEIEEDKKKTNKKPESPLEPVSPLIEKVDQSAEITSSADVEVVDEMRDQKTVGINTGSATKTTSDAHNKESVKDQIQSLHTIISPNLDSDSETVCLDENDHTECTDQLPQCSGVVDSTCNILPKKNSFNISVEKNLHLHDPRLTRKKTKSEKLIYLETLDWESTEKLFDSKVVPDPVSPKGDANAKPHKNRGPLKVSLNHNHSKPQNSLERLDSKENMAGVSHSHAQSKNENRRYGASSSTMSSSAQGRLAQRKQVSAVKERKDEIGMDKKSKVISKKPQGIVSVLKKRNRVIRDREVVCRYNHSVLEQFFKDSIPKLNLCCFVHIQRGECATVSKEDTYNFFDSIDTSKSYLPKNICRTEELTLDENKPEGVVNRTVPNVESKDEAKSDKTEQDEEIKFLAERVKESTTKVHQLNNSSAEPVIVKNKVLPKELFMKIYKTKPAKVSKVTKGKIAEKNDTILIASNYGQNKEDVKSSKKLSALPNKRITKQLYDPRYDSKVCGDKLREIFGEDLADVNVNRMKRKSEDVECLNFLRKDNISTYSEKRGGSKRMSVTCDDSSVAPKRAKIPKRRNTTHFSIIGNSDTAQDTSPVASRDCDSISETIQLISEEIQMTNTEKNVAHINKAEMPKNTSEDIINILSGLRKPSSSRCNDEEKIDCSRKKSGVTDVTASSTYLGLPSILSETIFEKTNVLPLPAIKYQNAVSGLVEDELTAAAEIRTGDVLVMPYIDLTVDDKNCESSCNVVISNVSTDISTPVGVKSEPDEEEILLNIKIVDGPPNNEEINEEIFSLCEVLGGFKGEDIGETYVNQVKFATSVKEEVEYFEEIVDICHSPLVEPAFAVSSDVKEYLVKAKFNLITVCSSIEKISIGNSMGKTVPSSQPDMRTFSQKQVFNHSIPRFSLASLRQTYLNFYYDVSEILKGYIPLQRGYSASYQLIYKTLQQFPHRLNNFKYEDLSLQLIMYDRRKYYGWLLLMCILNLPEDLPDFNFAEFLRVTILYLNKARIEIIVHILVQHLLELMVVYNYQYKQHKTSDKFRKNMEFFSDSFTNKKGNSQPESSLTQRQRALLKSQILEYYHLNANGMINLKHGKHFPQLTRPTQNASSVISDFCPPITVGTVGSSHQSMPDQIRHDNCITGSNSTLQQLLMQKKMETNQKIHRNIQNHPRIEHLFTKKYAEPTTERTILNSNTPANPLNTAAQTWNTPINQPLPPYRYSAGFSTYNTIKNTTSLSNNLQQNVNSIINSPIYTNSVHSNIPVEYQCPSALSLSTSSISDNRVLCTNQKMPPNLPQENISRTKFPLPMKLSRKTLPVTKMVQVHSIVKASSADIFTKNEEKLADTLSQSHNSSSDSSYSLPITALPVIQQMETRMENFLTAGFSKLGNTKTSTAGDCGLSLSTSLQFQNVNPLTSTSTNLTILPLTQLTENNYIPEPSAFGSPKQNISESDEITNRKSSLDGLQQLKTTCPSNTTLRHFDISTHPSEVIKLKTKSSGNNSSIQPNSVSHLTNNVLVNQLQPSVNEEASLTIIDDINNKVTNEKSSLNSNSIDSTSSNVDIIREEGIDTEKSCEDEVIDLTWMDDFTEEELTKEINQNEFMNIKIEQMDENNVASRSPGDSGIDSPTIQRDLNSLEADCHSIRVKEEDYPYFFSYQFE